MLAHNSGDDQLKKESIDAMKILVQNKNIPSTVLVQLVSVDVSIALEICKYTNDINSLNVVWMFWKKTMFGTEGEVKDQKLLRTLLKNKAKDSLPDDIFLDMIETISENESAGRFILMIARAAKNRKAVRDAIREISWFVSRRRKKMERVFREG